MTDDRVYGTEAGHMDETAYMRLFEKSLVRNCAPTLAGIKPANLFLCQEKLCHGVSCIGVAEAGDEGRAPSRKAHCRMLGYALRECRLRFEPLGLNVELLAKRSNGTLIYVYRPDWLRQILDDPECSAFLREQGYGPESTRGCLKTLRLRMRMESINDPDGVACNFPHEIGVFLGYPIEDVIGFVENEGANYIFRGYWKVYSNPEEATELFCRYKACRRQLVDRYEAGERLEDLMSQDKRLKGATI